jgi:hypothetical protein
LAGIPTARTVEEPGHCKLTITTWSAISVFLHDHPRRVCHCRASQGVLVFYRSDREYLGRDSAIVEIARRWNIKQTAI